jgi:hypothetical protein
MPRSRHSNLGHFWQRLTAHESTRVNPLYVFTFIIANERDRFEAN